MPALIWFSSLRVIVVMVMPLSSAASSPINSVPSYLVYRNSDASFVGAFKWRHNSNLGFADDKADGNVRIRLSSVDTNISSCTSHHKPTINMSLFNSIRGGDINAETSKEDNSRAGGISLSLFLTYLTVMGAKCALPSTLSMLTASNSGLAHHNAVLTRQDVMSRLLALSTVSIAAGKLLLGPVIDALGGVASLQIALSALFICLGSIGFGITCPTLTAFAIYWIIVDFAFSSCWAACVKTIRDNLSEERWSKEIGKLAMAARTGNAISFAFFASLLQWASGWSNTRSTSTMMQTDASWRWVFRASSIIQLVPLLMLTYFGKKSETDGFFKQETQSESSSRSTLKQSLVVLRNQSKTLEFWLHLISRSIIMVLVSFLLFIPSYMSQCYGMTSAMSARVGSMFALGCLASVSTLADTTYPSLAKDSDTSQRGLSRRKAYFMLAFLLLASGCLAIQTAFLQNTISLTPAFGTILMTLFGFSLAIPFYLPASMFALKRGGKEGSATIADAFDVCGFGLLAVFNGYVARVLDVKTKQAWLPVFMYMLGGSVAAMVSQFGAIWLEGERNE